MATHVTGVAGVAGGATRDRVYAGNASRRAARARRLGGFMSGAERKIENDKTYRRRLRSHGKGGVAYGRGSGDKGGLRKVGRRCRGRILGRRQRVSRGGR